MQGYLFRSTFDIKFFFFIFKAKEAHYQRHRVNSKEQAYCTADFRFRAPVPTHPGRALPRTQANKNHIYKSCHNTTEAAGRETCQAENGNG